MKAWRFAVLLGSAFALSACVLWDATRAERAAKFCGHGAASGDERAWVFIAPPLNAEAYKALAMADEDYAAAHERSGEYWFELPSGERKFCLSPLTRMSWRSGCDSRIAMWWEFTDTGAGLRSSGAHSWACVT